MASGQGSHWLTESPSIVHPFVAHPSEVFVNFVLQAHSNIHIPIKYLLLQLLASVMHLSAFGLIWDLESMSAWITIVT